MPNTNGGRMVKGIESICGQIVTSVICDSPGFDLTIRFENQHSLVVHCTEIGWDYDVCFSFGSPAGHYLVAFDGKVSFEARE